MAIRKVGVVGCGLMGGGIAQTCAQSGYEVVVREVNQELLDKGIARILSAWDMMATKGKLTAGQVDENRSRLHGTLNMQDFADCDLVIEAVIENTEEKLRLFPALDRIVKPEGILLSNTSSLNVTQMGAVTKRPQQVGGLHFFNPAPVMKLVEVVQTISTSEDTIETIEQFAILFLQRALTGAMVSTGTTLSLPFLKMSDRSQFSLTDPRHTSQIGQV